MTTIPEVPGPLPFVGNPPLSFRFMVQFLAGGGIPNPLDILFQKVSGIGSTIGTETIVEGGANHLVQRLPTTIEYNNLVLERGLVTPSPLSIEFNVAMSLLKFAPSNVLVILFDNTKIPIASWLFMKAYPVRWTISDLDATQNSVVIETLELTYQYQQALRL
jgi:phage tail-like protein